MLLPFERQSRLRGEMGVLRHVQWNSLRMRVRVSPSSLRRDVLSILMSGQASFAVGTLSGVFLLSGGAKLAQPRAFADFLADTVGQAPYVRAVARALPLVELVTGGLLLTPIYGAGMVAAIVLGVAFVTAGVVATKRNPSSGCGCFGSVDRATPHLFTLVRACAVLVLGVVCVAFARGSGPNNYPYYLALGVIAGVACSVASTLVAQLLVFLRGAFTDLLRSPEQGVST